MSFPQKIMHVWVGVPGRGGVFTIVLPECVMLKVTLSDSRTVRDCVIIGVRERVTLTVGVREWLSDGVIEGVMFS